MLPLRLCVIVITVVQKCACIALSQNVRDKSLPNQQCLSQRTFDCMPESTAHIKASITKTLTVCAACMLMDVPVCCMWDASAHALYNAVHKMPVEHHISLPCSSSLACASFALSTVDELGSNTLPRCHLGPLLFAWCHLLSSNRCENLDTGHGGCLSPALQINMCPVQAQCLA